MRKDKDKIEKGEISRRDFLIGAGSVVVGGAIGAGITYPLVAGKEKEVVTTKTVEITKTVEVPTTVTTTAAATTVTSTVAGPTKTVTTTVGEGVEPAFEPEVSVIRGTSHSGFGRDGMPARVDVKNDRIVRIRPLHWDEPGGYSADHVKPWQWTVNGKTLEWPMTSLLSWHGLAYKRRVYSPNRIKYPLKRVDWEPGGDPAKMNPQNRGISKYKRISWDEATDIIASEIDRIQKKYGYFAVFAQADGHGEGKTVHGPHGCQTQLLRWMGPDQQSSYSLQVRTPDSWEGWYWGGKHMWGMETFGVPFPHPGITGDVVKNTDLLLSWGDYETTTCGFSGSIYSRVLFWLTDLGKECVYLTPELNYAAAVHANKWIPVLPCTDAALHLAISYIWITEDTYDKDYVDSHTVGFDKYKAYVMGDEDGVPKTPEWASERCGTPVYTIKALARNWVKKTTSTLLFLGGAGIRGPYSSEPARMTVCNCAMQGMGAPGRKFMSLGMALPGSKDSISFDKVLVQGEPPPARGLEEWFSAYDYFRPHQFIPKTMIQKAILDAPFSFWGTCSAGMVRTDQFRHFEYPIPEEEGGCDIRMLWTDTPCMLTCWNGGNRYVEALRDSKIEFVLTEHPWLEDDTLLSDIILPTTTKYEEYDIEAGGSTWNSVWMVRDCVPRIGEAKTDYEVSLEVARKLEELGHTGLEDKYTWGRSVEDWMKYGWETRELESITGMTFEEFKDREFWVSPTSEGWEMSLEAKDSQAAFYEDPGGNPLQTPTGLIEFESDGLLKNFPDDKERPPVPHWVVGGPGWTHDESLDIEGGAEKCKKYPLMCQSNHPRWRVHAEHDDISWLREIPTCKVQGPDRYKYEPAWLNPKTAAERGIVSGDVVSVYNDWGTVLCGAYVTERMIPGAVYIDHGARTDPIVAGPDEWIDRGGVINLICPEATVSQNAGGQVGSGFVVEVEKTDLLALMAKYPEAFAKDYDPDSGLRFNGWVEGGID